TSLYTAKDTTRLTFSAATGLLLTVVDPQHLALTYTYDAANRLTKVQAPDGGVTTITYDATTARIAEPGDSVGSRTVVVQRPNGVLDSITDVDAAHSVRSFTYSGRRLTSSTWGGLSDTIIYDSAGRG